jgi:hypothetical protein
MRARDYYFLVNTTLEPRRVDKPFLRRWLRMSFALFLRSPVRFSLVIALLGWLDTSAVNLAAGYAVQKIWVDRLGMLVLPALWLLISAVARGADDSSQTWRALAALTRKQVWAGALVPGISLAAWHWIICGFVLDLDPSLTVHAPGSYLQHPGQFLDSIATTIAPISFWVGACYFPLLALAPDVSAGSARHLSKRASDINGEFVIWIFVATMVAGANVLVTLAPAYGMTVATFVVFMGIVNYVAYRDIFERRSENLPKAVTRARHSTPAQAIS